MGESEERRGKSRDGCRGHSPEMTAGLRRGEDSPCSCTLCGPKHSCFSDRYIIWLNPAIGQRPNTEVRQLCSNSHHCQTKQSQGAWPGPCKLPELAAGPRRTCSSECWITKQNIYNPENWRDFLSNRYELQLISVMSGDTEARQLRSGSRHY